MNAPRRIVLCGTSIFVAAIESGLSAIGLGEVLVFNPNTTDALARISALEPSVVIIEKVGGNQELARAVFQRGFPIIILDEAQRKITALSGPLSSEAKCIEAGIDELTQVIKQIFAGNWPSTGLDRSSVNDRWSVILDKQI